MRSRLRFLAMVAAAILAAAAAEAAKSANRGDLERRDINRAEERRAVCNDFSHAVYFMRQGTSPGWVIYFEGGGGCSNFSDCNQRYLNHPEQMKAPVSTSSIAGEDILSSDPTKNPVFHSYTHVLVPYCSSDAWLGNRTIERFDKDLGFSFDSSDLENSDNFVYAGQDILRAVIEDLCDLGLGNATDVVLVGSSAGGIGLLDSLDWINTMVPANTTRLVLDSSWFVGYTGHHVLQFSQEVAEVLNFAPPACHDVSLGYPCCVSPACLFTKGYLNSVDTPILAISSLYDIFTLEQPLRELIQREGQDDQALLALFNGYGSVVSESLMQSFKTHRSLSVYAPSCSQHVYLAPSGALRETTQNVYQESLFRLTNPVEAGNWERVVVRTDSGASLTLLQAVEQWANHSDESFFFTDVCSGPACGTCPSDISVNPETQLWNRMWNYLVLALAGLMTLVAVLIKSCAYLYMKYLLLQQRLYSIEVSRNPRNRSFPKPTHPVNISCTELSHHIELVRGSGKTPENHDVTDGQELSSSSPEHHYTNAKLELLVPCYRLLCSRWYRKWALWQESRTGLNTTGCSQSQLMHSTIIRPDSGISSSEDSVIKTRKTTQTEAPAHDDSTSHSSGDFDTRSFDADPNEGELPTRKHRKTILNQVNLYINPGELVAIMGPSGSGKTTLLDVLLNKRTTGVTDGEILINGVPMSKMRQWFVGNTGYVRQLATYYYNELTVRENLLFSMNMQAMRGMSLHQKLERVEQVIREMGLQEQADVRVGDSLNGGLSGGQRKRLAIAVQLLSVPNILFLDEPTSGLDSASSLEILKSLSMLAETGRAVVVTIHQPRSEIFHSFDKILLLCRGQVAFFGSPIKVWDFFTQALNYEDESLSDSGSSTNTADRILDLLKEGTSQQKVLQKYRSCGEPAKVKCAVWRGKGSVEPTPPIPLDSRNPGLWHRLVSLEARASLRQTTFTIIYLPIVYLVFGAILGTTYLYTNTPVQVMSVTCLLSCSSSLFMSSIIMSLLIEPLKLFQLEHSDGISSAHELILQVFIRMSTICTLPLAVCATLVFMLVYQNYSILVYVTVLLTFLLVNQSWLALFILFTVLYPQQAHRLCPVFSAIGGFCCGFIVPKPLMPVYYRWIFYINPSYYAYAATTVTVLHDNDLGGCTRASPLECFRVSSVAVLDSFGLGDVNPIEYMVILIGIVWVLLLLAIIILQLKVSYPVIKESLEPIFCCLVKGRKRRRQVHSSEALGLVEHNPSCSLHQLPRSDLIPKSSNSQPPNYDTVIDLDGGSASRLGHGADETDNPKCLCNTHKDSEQDKAISTDLLLDRKHKVEFEFPWERPQPVVDQETEFGDVVHQPPAVVPQPPQLTEASQSLPEEPARMECDGQSQEPISPTRRHHVVLHRGISLGLGTNRNSTVTNRGSTIFQNRRSSTIVQLTMGEEEEEGIDESTRRELATEKWKQRKQQMDIELKRLRHNEERERTRRYSGAFVHQALDPREQQTLSRGGGSASNLTRWKPASDRRVNRSRSMQVAGPSRGWSKLNDPLALPRLEITQEEEEEEEEEEEAGLGLPPKDVPFYEDKTLVGNIALDMSQIPVAEIAESIHSQNSDHSWNTGGEQDSTF